MQRSDVRSGIQRSWQAVDDLQLGETFSQPTPLEVDGEFRDIALTPTSTYSDVYLAGLNRSHYNFLLFDYSYFQFSWEKINHVRYAYYPNPFLATDEQNIKDFRRKRELVENGTVTHEDYLALLRDTPIEARVPALRYENSPDQRRELRHPCSHLHIGHHGDDRWPLNKLLSPLAFTLLVVKHYYGNEWRSIGDRDSDQNGNIYDSMLIKEKAEGCVLVSANLFSDKDAASFFLT